MVKSWMKLDNRYKIIFFITLFTINAKNYFSHGDYYSPFLSIKIVFPIIIIVMIYLLSSVGGELAKPYLNQKKK